MRNCISSSRANFASNPFSRSSNVVIVRLLVSPRDREGGGRRPAQPMLLPSPRKQSRRGASRHCKRGLAMTGSTNLSIERIGGSERIASLDVIRGIAILFILFMNIPWMGYYAPSIGDPRLVSWTAFDQTAFGWMIQLWGTQRGLLEILFGAGIMIMARRAMAPDGPVAVADLHYRRNWLLILFGLFNALVLMWGGDILLPYGITALMLFQFRLWRARTQ